MSQKPQPLHKVVKLALPEYGLVPSAPNREPASRPVLRDLGRDIELGSMAVSHTMSVT